MKPGISFYLCPPKANITAIYCLVILLCHAGMKFCPHLSTMLLYFFLCALDLFIIYCINFLHKHICTNPHVGPVVQLHVLCICRSRSLGGLGRIWPSSCSQNRLQEPRGRHRLSTVIQPLRQNAGEVVDLTVDEDGNYESSGVKIARAFHVMLENKTERCPKTLLKH